MPPRQNELLFVRMWVLEHLREAKDAPDIRTYRGFGSVTLPRLIVVSDDLKQLIGMPTASLVR